MRSSLIQWQAVHEVVNQLPISPVMFGVLTLVTFLFLLALVWAFRNMSNHR